MTTINDIADLVRILREQPEWAETLRGVLLTRELLELPAKFAEFVQLTQESNQLIDRRLTSLENRVGRLEEDVAEVKDTVGRLEERTGRLEEDVAQVKDTVGRLEERTGRLEETTGRMEVRMGRMEGMIGELQGAELERKVQRYIDSLAARHFRLRRPHILRSFYVPISHDLLDAAEDAELAGRISLEQFQGLIMADVILSGIARDTGEPMYVLAEVSRTIHNNDITRARERADTLAAVTDTQCLAVAVGTFIEPPQRRLAQELSVLVIGTPELDS